MLSKKTAPILIVLLLALGVTAGAAGTVTLYSQGIACIDETQTVTLTAGENTVDLPVPAGLIPSSLIVNFTGRVIAQSFHYTPPNSLLAAAVGNQIEVVGPAGSVYQGTLISTADGIALRDSAGRIIIIHDPRRITIAGADLSLSPYLELHLVAGAAGKVPIELTYLATGFNWAMNYVGTLTADGKALSITGWAQLDNDSNYTLSGVTLQLVAGNVNRVETNTAPRAMPTALAAAPMQPKSAFEYYLYTLPGVIDLPAHSSIRVAYGEFPTVPVQRIYTYDGARAPGVEVALRFANTKADGIGVPLPAGDVRLFQARSNGTLFIGADSIGHTPVGEEISLTAGTAFDITGTRVRTESVKLSQSTYRDTYTVTLRNHKDVPVTVNVIDHPAGNTWKIVNAGISYREEENFVTIKLPYEKVDSHTVKFVAYVPANGKSVITYTVEYSY